MERLICQNCGQDLVKEGEFYVCPYCGARYRENQAEMVADLLQDALQAFQIENLSKARRNLYESVHAKYPKAQTVIAACTAVLAIRPEDFLARAYLKSHDSDPFELISLLANEPDVSSAEAKEIFAWLIRDLDSRVVGATKDFVDRHLEGQEKTDALIAIEDEAEKIDHGLYDVKAKRDVFLCYSSEDMPRVVEIMDLLEESNLSCFAAFRNLRHGKGAQENYQNAIFTAMKNCRVFVFLSSNSSRSPKRTAVYEELDHLISAFPNKPRIEFLLEDYSARTSPIWKDKQSKAFPHLEYCRDQDDLVMRVTGLLDKEENAEKEKEQRIIQEATEKVRAEFEAKEAARQKELEERLAREEQKRLEREEQLRKEREEREEQLRKEREEREEKERIEREKRAEQERLEREKREEERRKIEEERLAIEREKLELEKKKTQTTTPAAGGSMDVEAFMKMQEEAKRLANKREAETIRKQQLEKVLGYVDDKYFYYGEYPQSEVTDEAVILALNNVLNNNPNIKVGEYFDYFGRKYIQFKNRFFRVQPIRWLILKKKEDHFTAVSDVVLDAESFGESVAYEKSNVRSLLVHQFLESSFPDKGKLLIPSPFESDLITLPTKAEVRDDMLYYKTCSSTDYAVARGLDKKKYGFWTRSNGEYSGRPYYFDYKGESFEGFASWTIGVRPIIRVYASQEAYDKAKREQEEKERLYRETHKTITLPKPPSDWKKVYCQPIGGPEARFFPGKEMKRDAEGGASLTIHVSTEKVVFSDGEKQMSGELPVSFDRPYEFVGKDNRGRYLDEASYRQYEIDSADAERFFRENHVEVRLVSGVPSSWGAVYCYAHKDNDAETPWPGIKMKKVDGVYRADVDKHATQIVFNNGRNFQSVELDLSETKEFALGGENKDGLLLDRATWDALQADGQRRMRLAMDGVAPYQKGDVIYYGSYPQSLAEDPKVLHAFEKAKAKNGSVMEIDGERFLYKSGHAYRFDPIEWLVGSQEWVSEEKGTRVLLAKCVLDQFDYGDAAHYSESSGRRFLNGQFLKTAFPEVSFALTLRKNNKDLVGLFTENDFKKIPNKMLCAPYTSYGGARNNGGIPSLGGTPGDYWCSDDGKSYWKASAGCFGSSGFFGDHETKHGLRPCICIDESRIITDETDSDNVDALAKKRDQFLQDKKRREEEKRAAEEDAQKTFDGRVWLRAQKEKEFLDAFWETDSPSSMPALPVVNGRITYGQWPQSEFTPGLFLRGPLEKQLSGRTGLEILSHKGESYACLTYSSAGQRIHRYFKVEPITWEIVKKKNGKALIVSTKILHDACMGGLSDTDEYPKSTLRKYLSGEFARLAFPAGLGAAFPGPVEGDKLFPLSQWELEEGGPSVRATERTAFGGGILKKTDKEYWTRTENEAKKTDYIVVGDDGEFRPRGNMFDAGVRPAMLVKIKE